MQISKKIELKATLSLWPYPNNARTHSPEQVAQIAASIQEFGFTNPILVGPDNGIIAGHGRHEAAIELGIDKVPCIRFSSLPISVRRNGVKDCLCADCGTEFMVRKDTSPVVCKRCASARGGRAMAGRTRAETKPCRHCGDAIIASKKDVFCSSSCRDGATKEIRSCKFCSSDFVILKSSVSPATNASGNFCSRLCYEKWMCNTNRVSGRGSRWLRISTEAKRIQPFCALCGTIKKLQVHHIVPFRLTFDNSQRNLVPLCVKHHKVVETITHGIEHSGSDTGTMKFVIGSILREHSMAVRTKIREIINERNRELAR